ncbi:MAG: hypothetical protein IJT78_01885 [Oscillospiraceae bacterium]|nr:hypothetical protein [Oscillospiraceae bacterium]
MRRILALAVGCVLLLCACGAKDGTPKELQARYEALETARIRAEITCHLPDESRAFTVTCDYEKGGQSRITVETPEELAGLGAMVGEELRLTWEDLTLAAGRSDGLSPCTCPVWLLHAAAAGYLVEWNRETWGDTPCLRLALDTTMPDGTKSLCTLWCAEEDGAPVYAEFSEDGALTISVKVLSFTPQP